MEHDYTRRFWGHNFTFNPIKNGKEGHMMGWGLGLANGDYLILPNQGKTTRYQIKGIKYFDNPEDMWSADVVFAPRAGR
jgi:hypothetical protein